MHQDISQVGSPPHTRGKAHNAAPNGAEDGITPAHAGKRPCCRRSCCRRRDHPRTRGEKITKGDLSGGGKGSPPHTRGKAAGPVRGSGGLGITPAHAGKRGYFAQALGNSEDHPRTRGEKRFPAHGTKSSQGSPPHTRGKVHHSALKHGPGGITPAHAGKRLNGSRF